MTKSSKCLKILSKHVQATEKFDTTKTIDVEKFRMGTQSHGS